jgi:O-antigen/teichoic acid export membrane protein
VSDADRRPGPVLAPGVPGITVDVRQVLRAAVVLAGGEVGNKAARFVAMVIFARVLSLHDFGVLGVYTVAFGALAVLARFGLPDWGARAVAHHPADAPSVAARVIGFGAAVFGTFVLIAVAITVVVDAPALPIVLAASLSVAALVGSVDWVLRGLERMSAAAKASATGGAVVLCLAASSLLLPASTELALLILGAGELAAATLTWWAVRDLRPRRPELTHVRQLASEGVALAASSTILYFYMAGFGAVALALVSSAEQAARYTATFRLYFALSVVVVFAAQALLPRLTQVLRDRPRDGRELVERSTLPLVVWGLVCLIGSLVIGEFVVRMLFGPAFGNLGSTLQLLCLSLPWAGIGFPTGYALIAAGRRTAFLIGSSALGVGGTALALGMTPFWGSEGASAANLIATIAGTLIWAGALTVSRAQRTILVALASFTLLETVLIVTDTPVPVTTLVAVAAAGVTLQRLARGRHEAPQPA